MVLKAGPCGLQPRESGEGKPLHQISTDSHVYNCSGNSAHATKCSGNAAHVINCSGNSAQNARPIRIVYNVIIDKTFCDIRRCYALQSNEFEA